MSNAVQILPEIFAGGNPPLYKWGKTSHIRTIWRKAGRNQWLLLLDKKESGNVPPVPGRAQTVPSLRDLPSEKIR